MLQQGEKYLIEQRIKGQLSIEPILYKRFKISFDECYFNIFNKYFEILEYVENEYPKNHIFRTNGFILDAMLFSLAYSSFIVPKFLKCNNIMNDFIIKKLKSEDHNGFSTKKFNEDYSEFQIFFYLFSSIYFRSDLYLDLIGLDYEPSGFENKKFEYSFKFWEFKLNIEVKALDCDPFIKDNVNMFEHNNGDLFYKSYFEANKNIIDKFIPEDITKSAIKISSNQRQLARNIKKIKKKCNGRNPYEVNIGFIIINYGTSREEYFSYLFNPKHGIMKTDGLELGDLHGLVLFSMYTTTTLFLDEIMDFEHAFTINDKIDYNTDTLFTKLRLGNYAYKNGIIRKDLIEFANEEWGLYKYVYTNGLVTILRENIPDNMIKEQLEDFQNKFNVIEEVVKLKDSFDAK